MRFYKAVSYAAELDKSTGDEIRVEQMEQMEQSAKE